MTTLRLRWTGGHAEFEPGTTVHIGRDPLAEVQPDNTNVSRRHAEVTFSRGVWTFRDLGRTQGTWRNGRQVETVEVRGTVQVTLGKEGRGELVTLEATAASPASTNDLVGVTDARAEPGAGATEIVGGARGGSFDEGAGTVVVGAATHRPGGALREDAVAGATVVTGDVLNVECAGRSYSFSPGRDVTFGRDDTCDVVSTNPTVSRVHARVVHDGSGWTLRDAGSSGGTYVGDERVSDHTLSGSTAAWLGDPTTGERVVIVAKGETTTRRSTKSGSRSRLSLRTGLLIAGAVVLVAIAGWVVMSLSGSDETVSEDVLGRATVRLVAGDFAGSGTIVDAERGLILTNTHVVAPDAPGSAVRDMQFDFMLDPSPRRVQVLVAPELGKAAEPRFFAEVVAVDGYLDLAVLRITETTAGRLVLDGSDDLDGLAEVAVGDSRGLVVGDEIRVFGYPAAAQTVSASMTAGEVMGSVADARLASNDAMLNISADISPGNSGGLAVDEQGRLVGIPTLFRDETVASMRPSEFAEPLLEAVRTGEPYETPWVRLLADETIGDLRLVAPSRDSGTTFDCENGPLKSLDDGAVGLAIEFDDFEVGQHQDLLVWILSGKSIVGRWALDLEYPVTWPASGSATVTVPLTDASVPVDGLTFVVGLGATYDTDL